MVARTTSALVALACLAVTAGCTSGPGHTGSTPPVIDSPGHPFLQDGVCFEYNERKQPKRVADSRCAGLSE